MPIDGIGMTAAVKGGKRDWTRLASMISSLCLCREVLPPHLVIAKQLEMVDLEGNKGVFGPRMFECGSRSNISPFLLCEWTDHVVGESKVGTG